MGESRGIYYGPKNLSQRKEAFWNVSRLIPINLVEATACRNMEHENMLRRILQFSKEEEPLLRWDQVANVA